MKCVINKSFATSIQRTPRVLEIAEAFGLGLDEKQFEIYRDFELELVPGDIVYITGQSGSGKSLLLRELAQQLTQEFTVANIDDVTFDDKPLIEQVGENTDESVRILSAAGLTDANMFIRKPDELSDGQKYRFRIAKLLESGQQVWVADEFGAVLDRITAKAVAFNLHKQAKRANAIVIVATTHKDLLDELAPSIYIDKRYQDKMEVRHEKGDSDLAA